MTSSKAAPATARRRIVFQWEISSRFGWGVYGLNLMLAWAGDPDLAPLTSCSFSDAEIDLDPAPRAAIAPLLEGSRALQAELSRRAGQVIGIDALVLKAMGNGLTHARSAHNTDLVGRPTIAVPFIENTLFPAAAVAEARDRYALWIAGSAWNAELLAQAGLGPVKTVMQGIDPAIFHPGPRTGRHGDRFVVFSGGKLEYRKGQDLVLLAFKAFAARHRDALLVTAWRNPWREWVRTVERNPRVAPVVFDDRGGVDVTAWVAANGIAPEQVVDLGTVANRLMGQVLREADVAVFPNRGEGGTNLVAMEAMACGVPTILAANTGQLDLIRTDNCYPLMRQTPIAGAGCQGWGESDVDEIVEALERVWQDRERARAIGRSGAAFMRRHSWSSQVALLKEVIRPYCS